MKRFAFPLLILLVGFGVYALLSSRKEPQQRRPPQPFVRTVLSAPVRYTRVQPRVTAGGRVNGIERIALTPEVSGLVATEGFRLRKGTSFSRGEVLLKIDDRQARYDLGTAVSDLQNALTSLLPELKSDIPEAYDRWQAFFTALRTDSLPELPETLAEREKLLVNRLNVFKLYYASRNQRLTLEKHTIRAPFSGTVEDASVFPASMARAGVAAATVARTDEVEVELALPARDARVVKPGMAAEVRVDGNGEPAAGTVHRLSAALDERMQTVATFVRVANAVAQEVRSGAFASVTIRGAAIDHAMVIPRKALHDVDKVYIIEKGLLAERQATLAYTGIDSVVVTDGMPEGVELITEPLQDAIVGMAVQTPAQAEERQAALVRRGGAGRKDGKAASKKSVSPSSKKPAAK